MEKSMNFEEWLYKVVEFQHKKFKMRIEENEIYSSIELYDAKLQFLDGVKPEEFTFN